MDEAIYKGWQIWDKIRSGNITSFNFSDIIWLFGSWCCYFSYSQDKLQIFEDCFNCCRCRALGRFFDFKRGNSNLTLPFR